MNVVQVKYFLSKKYLDLIYILLKSQKVESVNQPQIGREKRRWKEVLAKIVQNIKIYRKKLFPT